MQKRRKSGDVIYSAEGYRHGYWCDIQHHPPNSRIQNSVPHFHPRVRTDRPSFGGAKLLGGRFNRPYPSHREQVLAAQVRVRADKRRGVKTPQWIIELAKETK